MEENVTQIEDVVMDSNAEPQKKKKTYASLDLLKFIMAIVVVSAHTNYIIGLIGTSFIEIQIEFMNALIKDTVVPIFFVISAFLLFEKMKETGDGNIRSEKSLIVLKKYSFKMLKMYLIWMLIYMPMNVHVWVSDGTSATTVLLGLLISPIFAGGSTWVTYPLWYMIASFYVSIVLYFLLKTKLNVWWIMTILIAIFFLGKGFTVVYERKFFSGVLGKIVDKISIVLSSDNIFYAFLYFGLTLAVDKLINVNKYIWLASFIVLFAISTIFKFEYLDVIVQPIMHMSLFLFVVNIKMPENKALLYLRKQSSGIYFIHMIFVFILRFFGLITGIWCFLITISLAFLATAGVIALQKTKRFKFLKVLF